MVLKYGEIIKNRRIELGITQDELAGGICSVLTLSRIERGIQTPQDYTLAQIMQRLGLSGSEIILAVNKKQLVFSRLKFDIRQAYIQDDYKEAERILQENKKQISELTPFDRQTFETIDILLKIRNNEYAENEALELLEAALRLTSPQYTKVNLPMLFTYEEILLLNNIAIRYAHLGDLKTAVYMLYHIKEFYDKKVCDIEEALRTEPMVLYNLSKYLGLAGRIDECLAICERGINIGVKTRRCSSLAKTLYNKAYALNIRNKPGDKEASLYYAKQAYHLADVLEMHDSKERYRAFIKKNFAVEVQFTD